MYMYMYMYMYLPGHLNCYAAIPGRNHNFPQTPLSLHLLTLASLVVPRPFKRRKGLVHITEASAGGP